MFFGALLSEMPTEGMMHLASGAGGGGLPAGKPSPGVGTDPDVVGAVQDDVGAVGARGGVDMDAVMTMDPSMGMSPTTIRRPPPPPLTTPAALNGIATPTHGRAGTLGSAPMGLAGTQPSPIPSGPTSTPAFELADTSAAYLDAWNLLNAERPQPADAMPLAPMTVTAPTAGASPQAVAAANPLNPLARAAQGPMGGALAPMGPGGFQASDMPPLPEGGYPSPMAGTLPAGGFQTRPTPQGQPGRRPLSPFEAAFAQARAAGQAQFVFNGRPYTTQMAGEVAPRPAPTPGVMPTPRPIPVPTDNAVAVGGREGMNVAPGPMPVAPMPARSQVAGRPMPLGPAAPPTGMPPNLPPELAAFMRQMIEQYGPGGAASLLSSMGRGA